MSRGVLLVFFVSLIAYAIPSHTGATVLITTDEAKLPAAASEKSRGIRPRVTIEQISPQRDAGVKSPVHLIVKFTPHNETSVDLSTLKVFYLKQPLIDLTDRIAPYASKAGIDMPNAEIPPGTHLIRFRLTDSQGSWAAGTITLIVLR